MQLQDRFWKKVDKRGDDECWQWLASTKDGRYGAIGLFGRVERSHRVAFFLSRGYMPVGLVVMHTCDNPRCCNPKHLVAGTQADNVQDMLAKGRYVNQNAEKTHCPKGHPYDETNTYHHSRGWRKCRTCWKGQPPVDSKAAAAGRD